MKKNPLEMKNNIAKIKNILQGINRLEAEDRVRDLEQSRKKNH